MIPGEIQYAEGDIEINKGLETVKIRVTNTGDRPIQIGSHYHFFEVNPALKFEREKAYGYRLDIPSGTSIRFEPGQSQTVRLVPYRGERVVYGFRGWVNGKLDDPEARRVALQRMRDNYNPGQDAQAGGAGKEG
ncbi:MAG: urease subunit beta [Isosphaeraceae bacterium]|nr:urease subunit beta [Isosphaeraceae bacterium]